MSVNTQAWRVSPPSNFPRGRRRLSLLPHSPESPFEVEKPRRVRENGPVSPSSSSEPLVLLRERISLPCFRARRGLSVRNSDLRTEDRGHRGSPLNAGVFFGSSSYSPFCSSLSCRRTRYSYLFHPAISSSDRRSFSPVVALSSSSCPPITSSFNHSQKQIGDSRLRRGLASLLQAKKVSRRPCVDDEETVVQRHTSSVLSSCPSPYTDDVTPSPNTCINASFQSSSSPASSTDFSCSSTSSLGSSRFCGKVVAGVPRKSTLKKDGTTSTHSLSSYPSSEPAEGHSISASISPSLAGRSRLSGFASETPRSSSLGCVELTCHHSPELVSHLPPISSRPGSQPSVSWSSSSASSPLSSSSARSSSGPHSSPEELPSCFDASTFSSPSSLPSVGCSLRPAQNPSNANPEDALAYTPDLAKSIPTDASAPVESPALAPPVKVPLTSSPSDISISPNAASASDSLPHFPLSSFTPSDISSVPCPSRADSKYLPSASSPSSSSPLQPSLRPFSSWPFHAELLALENRGLHAPDDQARALGFASAPHLGLETLRRLDSDQEKLVFHWLLVGDYSLDVNQPEGNNVSKSDPSPVSQELPETRRTPQQESTRFSRVHEATAALPPVNVRPITGTSDPGGMKESARMVTPGEPEKSIRSAAGTDIPVLPSSVLSCLHVLEEELLLNGLVISDISPDAFFRHLREARLPQELGNDRRRDHDTKAAQSKRKKSRVEEERKISKDVEPSRVEHRTAARGDEGTTEEEGSAVKREILLNKEWITARKHELYGDNPYPFPLRWAEHEKSQQKKAAPQERVNEAFSLTTSPSVVPCNSSSVSTCPPTSSTNGASCLSGQLASVPVAPPPCPSSSSLPVSCPTSGSTSVSLPHYHTATAALAPSVPVCRLQWQPSPCASQEAAWILEKRQIIVERCVWQRLLEEAEQHFQDANKGTSLLVEGASAKRVWCFWVQEMRVKIALIQEEQRRRLQKVVSRKATLVGKPPPRRRKQRNDETLSPHQEGDAVERDKRDQRGEPAVEAVSGIEAEVGEEELQRELAEAECLLPLELDPTVLAVITAKTAVQLTLVPKACTSVLPGRKGRAGGAEGREASAELMAEHEDARRLLSTGRCSAAQHGVFGYATGSTNSGVTAHAQEGEQGGRATRTVRQKKQENHATIATTCVSTPEKLCETASQAAPDQSKDMNHDLMPSPEKKTKESRGGGAAKVPLDNSNEEESSGHGRFLDAMAAALRQECAQRQVPVTQMALAIAEAVNLELNAVRLERQGLGEDASLSSRPGVTGPNPKDKEHSSASLLSRSRLLKEHELLAKRAQGKLNGAERRQLHRLLLCESRHETWDIRKKLKVGGILVSVLLKHAFVEAEYSVAKAELAEELKQLEHERQLLRRAAERKKKKADEEKIAGVQVGDRPATCPMKTTENNSRQGDSTGHTKEIERMTRPTDLSPVLSDSSTALPEDCPAAQARIDSHSGSCAVRSTEDNTMTDVPERPFALGSSPAPTIERQKRRDPKQGQTNKVSGEKREDNASGKILYGEAWDAEAFAHLTVYRSRRCFTKVEVPAFHHRVIYNPRTQRSLGVVEMRRLCYSQLANCGEEEKGSLTPSKAIKAGGNASLPKQQSPHSAALVAHASNSNGNGDFRKLPAGPSFASSPAFWSFLKFLPMVYPPVPWTGFSEGGYLMLRNSFVRAVTYTESKGPLRRKSKGAEEEDIEEEEDNEDDSDMEDESTQSSGGKEGSKKKKSKKSPKKAGKITFLGGAGRVKMARDFRVYDTSVPREILSALGSQPWRVNREVLGVMETAWERGIRIGRMPSREGWSEAEQGFHDPSSFSYKQRNADYSILSAIGQKQMNGEETFSTPGGGSWGQNKESGVTLAGLRGALDPARIRLQHLLQEEAKMRSERPSFLLKLRVAQCFQHVDTLYFPHNIDFRGRCYPVPPHLNHMGDDICRALLVFAQPKPLGPRGLFWLKVHLANLFGKNKMSFVERQAWIDERLPTLLEVAKDPLSPRSVEVWGEEAEDPWQALGALLELKRALDSGDPANYASRQPVHQDGSCNGLQHYAALGRDARGGAAVNLVPGERPQDVYSLVLEVVKTRVHADIERKPNETEGSLALLLKQLDLLQRKVVKQTVMTICYGVTALGARDQVTRQLQDLVGDKLPPETVKQLGSYLARTVLASIGEVFKSAMRLKQWLDRVSKLSNRVGLPVAWMLPIVNLAAEQPYRSTQALEVKTALQCHIIRVTNEDTPTSAAKQRLGFPPNFIHSLDATHMMLTARRCLLGKTFSSSIASTLGNYSDVPPPAKLQDTPFAFSAVHDSYWTHAADVDRLRQILREEFVHLYSQPILEDFYECLRARFGRLAEELPPPPAKGSLDLRGVLKSEYFFH